VPARMAEGAALGRIAVRADAQGDFEYVIA
jgi:hypothetical protein